MAFISLKDFTEQRFDYSGGRVGAPELTLMVGISGSGKSVLAKSWVNWGRGDTIRLNRDNLRAMLYCDVPWNGKLENLTRNYQQEGARMALQMGKNVIIDDTNCIRQTRQKWEEFAKQQRVIFRTVTMTTPIDVCIERDSKREGKERVGEGVIRKQYKDLNEVKVAVRDETTLKLTRPYMERTVLLRNGGFLPRLPGAKWVLVDVDGTVAEMGEHRGPFEETKVLLDNPRETVCDWVRAIYPHYNVCVVSGRHDFCGDDTCEWLDGHGVPFDRILMRYSGDNRGDDLVKKEILDELVSVIGEGMISFILDDRPRVVRMWRNDPEARVNHSHGRLTVYPVRGFTVHSSGCPTAEAGTKGYRECPDCGALEDF
jgi:predicted kinase